jgi:hypothetical protein
MPEEYKLYNAQNVKAAMEAAGRINVASALGDTAHKQKRNLVSWSAVALLVQYYNIHLTKIPWIDAEIPPGASDAGIVIVAAPLLYSLFGFLLYAVADLKKWRFDDNLNYFEPTWQMFFRLTENIWAVRSHVDPEFRQANINPEQRNQIIEEALTIANHGIDSLQSLQHQGERLTRWKRFTVYGWEVAIPLALGLLALWYAVPPLTKQLARVFCR